VVLHGLVIALVVVVMVIGCLDLGIEMVNGLKVVVIIEAASATVVDVFDKIRSP